MASALKTIQTIQAKTVSVGRAPSLADQSDVDMSQAREGSILIYSADTETFVAKNDLDNQNVEGGHY